MKSMWPPSAAIFFMTYFHRARGEGPWPLRLLGVAATGRIVPPHFSETAEKRKLSLPFQKIVSQSSHAYLVIITSTLIVQIPLIIFLSKSYQPNSCKCEGKA